LGFKMAVGDIPKQVVRPRSSAQRVKKRAGIVPVEKYVDTVLGCRYEMKYRISESKARAIEQFIKPYLHLDRYSRLRPGGFYPLVSLYLDSNDFKLCRETLTGKKNRFKLRIRCYSDDTEQPRFLEIKRRVNNVILKSRSRIRDEDVSAIFSGKSLSSQKFKSDENAMKQFILYVNSINAKPKILIRYMRQAFESDSDNRVRVTLDRELSYKASSEPKVRFGGVGWQRHPLDKVILEIKFTARYPAWLSRMIQCFDLGVHSTSKYATSIQHSCHLGFCGPKIVV
jgi:VTC domain